MASIKDAASAFLANKRIAVTGVSRHPQGHGSNVVYKRLRDRGYQVFAVNPRQTSWKVTAVITAFATSRAASMPS